MQGPRRSTVAGIAVVAIAVAAVAALVFLPTIVSAQETSWTITAREEDACSSDKTYCFDLSQSSFEAGTTVNATFENPSDNGQTHDALVELDGTWDTSHDDTATSDSDGGVEGLDPGNSSSFEFTVPSDRSDFYLWCDVTGHESLGMWVNVGITGVDGGNGGGNGDGTNGGGTDGGDGPSTPGFSAVAGVAAVGAALVLLKHRRD